MSDTAIYPTVDIIVEPFTEHQSLQGFMQRDAQELTSADTLKVMNDEAKYHSAADTLYVGFTSSVPAQGATHSASFILHSADLPITADHVKFFADTLIIACEKEASPDGNK